MISIYMTVEWHLLHEDNLGICKMLFPYNTLTNVKGPHITPKPGLSVP